jgi:hypothetical protein
MVRRAGYQGSYPGDVIFLLLAIVNMLLDCHVIMTEIQVLVGNWIYWTLISFIST